MLFEPLDIAYGNVFSASPLDYMLISNVHNRNFDLYFFTIIKKSENNHSNFIWKRDINWMYYMLILLF